MGTASLTGFDGETAMTKVPRLLKKTIAYFVIWSFVVGQATLYALVLGVLCALAVAWVDLHRSPSTARPFPWARLVPYVPWLIVRMVQSGWHMTRLILHPRLPIDPQIISYKPRLRQPAGLVLLGNSITLMPGTITAEITSDQLLVHAIDSQSGEDIVSGKLEDRVAQMFDQVGRGER
jgi:multicomponent Na+:H+ antiporter subunit E